MVRDVDSVQDLSAFKSKWLFMPELLHRSN